MSEPRPQDYAVLLKRSLLAIDQLKAQLASVEQSRSEPIAVVGIGCRFPGDADTPSAFWKLLSEGIDAVTEVPKERWDVDKYFDPNPDAPGKSYTRWGAFIKNVDLFDASFFGVSPREAISLDPQQRVLLEVTWEALEDAGIAPSSLAGSQTAVYMGITTHDYAMQLAEAVGSRNGDAYTPSGTAHSVAVGRLSYVLGLHGPNVAIDTACSSSLVAMHWAAQSLRNREADVALAGGINLTLTPDGSILTSRARMMSFDGRCKTFDASADGYVRGEGCGVLVLKRLSDAERDGDRVCAVLRGSALNQDGRSSGLTAPNGPAQEAVIRAALANARVAPHEVSYVEAHGTGTPLGDPIEVKALNAVYGADRPTAPLLIGSVKTNIGHLEAAAGVAGVIKTVLALQHRVIPPHLHLRTPNPLIDWPQYPIQVATAPTQWRSDDGVPRRAGISSFGFSGTNAHVVLEEAPDRAPVANITDAPHHLLALSAQTPAALHDLARRYVEVLSSDTAPPLEGLTATAALGRSHFPERLAVMAASPADAREKLEQFLANESAPGVVRGRAAVSASPEIVFMFTGQGAQYPGMARQLFEAEPVFRAALEECDRLVLPHLGRSLLAVMFADGVDSQLIDDTAYTQPALFAVEYSLAQLWKSWGIEPTTVMGHSVGEYVAACLAGVFSLEDGLKLIVERGRLMSALPRDGAMAAVFAEEQQVRQAIAGQEATLAVAAVNGPQSIVVSGLASALDALLLQLTSSGVEWQRLKVSHAFHSPLMNPMLDKFEAVASQVAFHAPRIGLMSNLSGKLAGDEVRTADYWRRHLRDAVRFSDCIVGLHQDGYRLFLEVGPAPALLGMAQRCGLTEATWVGSLRKGRPDTAAMREHLAQLYVHGVAVNWPNVLGAGATHRRAVAPSYPFQREAYWQELGSGRQRTRQAVGKSGHPLLGELVPSPFHIFESEIGPANQPWLADHRIFGYTLFPATGFLELATAAAREALGTSACELRGVTIREGLVLPDDDTVTVQVIAQPQQDGTQLIQVFSRQNADEGQASTWKLHAAAIAAPSDGGTPEPRDADALARRVAEPFDVKRYYDRLEAQGAHYGPAFRGIGAISRAGREVLGRIQLPEAIAGAAGQLLVHPALLDACFQLVGAGLPWADLETPSDDICIPVGLDGYRVYRSGAVATWCHVVVAPAPDHADVFRCDLALLDDDRAVIAEVKGLELRRITRSALKRAIGKPAQGDWLFETDWPVSPLDAPRAPHPRGRWVVLTDDGGTGRDLVRLLEGQGDSVTVVSRGATADLSPALRATSADPLVGIVDLRALDAPLATSLEQIEATHRELMAGMLALGGAVADVDARTWVVTRGTQAVAGSVPDLMQAAVWAVAGVIASEHPALRLVRLDLDPVARPDDAQRLFEIVWSDDVEDRIALRGSNRHVARLVPGSTKPAQADAAVRLEITERGTLENLSLSRVEREAPGPGEVEIRVHATGLNFRDVLNALGMYPGDPGPLGNECAGVISAIGDGVDDLRIGDEVVAMVDRSFATWVVAPAVMTVRKPAELTFVEAATIPVTFLTAQYALRDLARIKKGDRVLIHAITGGVGMAACQLARRAGAEIFGTAGTPAKRALATSLGADHVGDSRSLSFAADVMRATNGEGVDIVLNSLAGDFIPESLRLLRDGGHFIEIGKTGIWDDVKVAREFPGVHYHPLYLGEVAAARPAFVRDMLRGLLLDLQAGSLKPLPHKSYPLERAEDAFRFMGQGHHVGKIVIRQDRAPAVHADASYLITGGTGGLGLECARWLASEGARHLVLMGRRPPSPAAENIITTLRENGATVTVALADVADRPALSRILDEVAASSAPLRGILHAAGIVDDGMVREQTPERFARVMAPKVTGTWNLHTLTNHLPLDFFVMFSSGAALLGSPGQSNYAAANSFLDALSHVRRARGQHALSINWGSWSGVGMAAGVGEAHQRRWAAMGLSMIAPDDGVRMLQDVLYANRTAQAAILPLVRSRLPSNLGPFFSGLLAARATAPHGQSAAGATDILSRLSHATAEARPELLAAFLTEQVVKVLALGSSHKIDRHRSLMEMGMDSLMAMELRNRLQTSVNARIAVADLLQGTSIHQLTMQVLDAVVASAASSATPESTLVAPRATASSEVWEEGSL